LDEKESRITGLLTDINTLSNQMEDVCAENRQLRKMANVPDNYRFEKEIMQIKLHDKERIEDYKKLIKVLQDDNYKLEEERANLKHAIKLQAMMFKSNETDPRLRYKDLTDDQLLSVDNYVIRLIQGSAQEPADFYKLRRQNDDLKAEIDRLKNSGLDQLNQKMQQLGMMNQQNL